MKRCASVKKKGSVEQCTSKPVMGHTLCGRHAKMKHPILWVDSHKKEESGIVKCQALVRGWILRKYMRLCGPGVLCRKDLINDEDLVTCEDKNRQHPFDYFGVEENGKIWWFDFGTIYTWCSKSIEPTNPYSKTPFPSDVRRRLREIWRYRHRTRQILPKESSDFQERKTCRWNLLCQIFREYGFTDVHPEMFADFAKITFYTMFRMIEEDVRVSLNDKSHYKAPILRICGNMLRGVHEMDYVRYVLSSQLSLLIMLNKPKDPYVLIFTILSALHRC